MGAAMVAAVVTTMSVVLTGCVSNPPATQVDQPVSQQSAVGDIRKRAKAHTDLGSAYLGDGRFAVALDEARVAISVDSDYAPAYNLLGLVHMYLQEPRLAEENFDRALHLAPADAEINNNFGWFLCQTGREQRSIAYFQAAIKSTLYETPAKPLTNAGICSLRLKDDKAAEAFLTNALRADNTSASARFWLADLLYRQNRLGEARVQIGELFRLAEPEAQSIWLALRIEHKFGDRDAEARYSSQLRRKFAGTPEHQKLLQGQYE
jgi:type IV pilus assembly protein PilF